MAQLIRIKMMDEEVVFDLSENTITKSSITSAFLLPDDTTVLLSYDLNGRRIWCLSFSVLPDPAPSFETYPKWMFYLHKDNIKTNVICVHPRFCVTFRHGTHVQLTIGDLLTMYSAIRKLVWSNCIKSTISFCFRANQMLYTTVQRSLNLDNPNRLRSLDLGMNNRVSFLHGLIYTTKSFYFDSENGARYKGPFILGSSRSSKGYGAILEAAVFSAKNIMTVASRFKDAFETELCQEQLQEKVSSPPPKKRAYMTDFDSTDVFYGSSL
ncbi:hypothetical protein M3Y95_00558900 [Aphelenchoides besseyi]|nr:hypothetical protein M3Y95_00558900 [Aphelenchoides besseyi]